MLRRILALTSVAAITAAPVLPAQDGSSEARPTLKVTATEYDFEPAVTTIQAGWTSVELMNRGEATHMLEFARLPAEGSYDEVRDYLHVRDTLEATLNAGVIDSSGYQEALNRRRSAWFDSIESAGGVGNVAPGRPGVTTLRLEPGTYVMLCYVEDSAGTLHYRRGMHNKLTVTEDSSGALPPDPDVELTLSGYQITTDGRMQPGRQTVAIHFGERSRSGEPPFQNLHLVRLGEGGDWAETARWMNDREVPAPVEFLGGTPAMPSGTTVYLTVDLTPDRYGWVSNASEAKGMVETFTVP